MSCAPHDKTVNTVKSNLADEIETSTSGQTENLRKYNKTKHCYEKNDVIKSGLNFSKSNPLSEWKCAKYNIT